MSKFKPNLPQGYRCRCIHWSDARGCCDAAFQAAMVAAKASTKPGELFSAPNGVELLSAGG